MAVTAKTSAPRASARRVSVAQANISPEDNAIPISLRGVTAEKALQALHFGSREIESVGERGLTLAYISSGIGAPTTTLYHLFGNREGYLHALRRHACRTLATAVMNCISTEDHRAAAAGVYAYVRFVEKSPRLYALMSSEERIQGEASEDNCMTMVSIALREVIATNIGMPFDLAKDLSTTLLLIGRGMSLGLTSGGAGKGVSAIITSNSIMHAVSGMLK